MKDNITGKKTAFIVLVILLIGVLVIGAFFRVSNRSTSLPIKEESKKDKSTKLEEIKIKEDYSKVMNKFNLNIDDLNNRDKSYRKIVFVKNDLDYINEYVLNNEKEAKYYDDMELYYTYNCSSRACEIIDRTSIGVYLIHDKNYYLFDMMNKKYMTIDNIDFSKYGYVSLINGCISYKDEDKYTCDKGLLYGMVLNAKTEEDNDIFYNLLLDKVTIDKPDTEITDYIDYYYLNRGLIEVSNKSNNGVSLYDFTIGKEKENSGVIDGRYYVEGDTFPYISYYNRESFSPKITILDKQLNRVFDEEFDNTKFVNDTKSIYQFNKKSNEYYKYDFDNNELKNIKTKYELLDVIENTDTGTIYEIVIIDEIINIVSEDKIIYNTNIDINNVYSYDYYISGYYKKDKNVEKGLYLVYSNDKYGFMQEELYYNIETGETRTKELPMMVYDKPVIYLYPEKEMDINVSFKNPNDITVSYPKYNDGWNILAYPDGSLYDKDSKYYYALYFEENGSHIINYDEGFYVESDNAIEFLEEKLSLIGLNDKERNEMIMYWLPILESNKKSIVYFELTEERNKYNELIVNPKPDSVLRVSMHVKKVSKKTSIKTQILPKFERKGFSVIEWGGTSE